MRQVASNVVFGHMRMRKETTVDILEELKIKSHNCTIPGWAARAAKEIERLRAALKEANIQAERFEREWYLRGDVLEEAIAWSESEQGRAVPQVDGQPGDWINKARDLMRPNAPHEGADAALSRTLPLDAVVGRRR